MNEKGSPTLERRPQVQARTGLSTASLYGLMGKGEFPRPVKIGPKAVAWRASDVDAWIESRLKSPGLYGDKGAAEKVAS